MTDVVNRRARIARKLYISAWWLLGAGWLVVTIAVFVTLKPATSQTVRVAAPDEWEDVTPDTGMTARRKNVVVEVPGVGNVEFPGNMSDEDIAAVLRQVVPSRTPTAPAGFDPDRYLAEKARDAPARRVLSAGKARLEELPPPKLSDRVDEKSPLSRAPAPAEFRMPTWIKEWALGSALAGLPWALLVVGNRWLRWLLA